ncbi:MAG TPA: TMEM175 family protein [Microbacteriaceae bacterium]|nr:TMEM175 family protein [Microbacteriaceae bacterium]
MKKPHSFDQDETPRQRYRRILDAGRETERTVFFSDAVMAIAMTLLVLEIKIPDAVHDPTSASDTADDVYALVAYVLAFILIAINWMAHHRTFRVIERFDRQLQLINFGFLFFIATVPLPLRYMAEFGTESSSVMLFGFVLAMPSLFLWWLWRHAFRARLCSSHVDVGLYRYVRRAFFPIPIVAAICIIGCLVIGPQIGMYFWVAVIPAYALTMWWPLASERRGWSADEG